ncbi:hypothetical protein GQ44DRAFT_719987 [Phaeosphaeriaceae sp. PMI808]|nr:hypothetical protein GQ44DRAFT_719987 [Phaeosphaeriaceae sp. PMI808]
MVDERNNLILNASISLKSSETAQLTSPAKLRKDDYIHGFTVKKHDAGYLEAHVDPTASIGLLQPLDGKWTTPTSTNPEQDFQTWVDQPTNRVKYLIGPPWIQDHFVNDLLSSGPSLERRPPIPGVNQPYWYLSLDANTPATVHIEDANTGPANLLPHGADKRWLVINRSSVDRFEKCMKRQFSRSREC